MQKEKSTTVIFRRFKDGEIIALFPYEIVTKRGEIQSYMHIGQHGGADPFIIHETKLASPIEYADLQRELESIGYVLDIKKRMSWAKYRKVCRTACI